MMVKYCVRVVVGFCLALGLAACNVGLGQEVDLEGPVLSITSHANLDYVGQNVEIGGTVTDNQALGRVELRHVLSASESTLLANAVISSSTWFAEINLPEGEQTIEAIAYDRAGNTSHLSKAIRTLLVDTTLPNTTNLETVRNNGSRSKLQLRETLEALDETEKENRDLFHNELVRFEASIDEDYPLESVSLHLHDETGTEVLVLENTSSNDKAPSFELTHEALVAANSSYAGGRSYLRVTLEAADLASNPLNPEAEINIDQFGWFAWYPEADTPHIIQNLAVDGDIQITAGNSLFFDFWDDDELDTVHVGMMSPSDWTTISGGDDAARLAYLEDNETARANLLGPNRVDQAANTFGVNFPVGDTSGEYRLVAMARDAKDDGKKARWNSRVYALKVSDEDAPVTFIETPQQNSVPTVDLNGNFTIRGYTLDNRGATALFAAWIPVGSGVANSAVQEALAASSLKAGYKDSLANGVVIYRLALTDAAEDRTINGKTYKQHDFSLVLKIFDDFMYKGTLQNDEKNFIFFTRDADSNEVFQTFKLLGDSALPVLSGLTPSVDLEVHDIDDDLLLSFTADKPSGLAISNMVIEDYTDSSNPSTLFEGVEVDTASVTIAAASLSEGRRTYRYTATDALGNTATAQRTVIISALPALEYISSSRADGTYKAGDELIFLAKFSKAVRVTGSPLLRLWYTDPDATDKYAAYSSGSGTDTLFFTWTVPAGASSIDLRSHSAPIDLNGGVIQTTEGTGGVAFIAGLGGQPDLGEADSLHGRKDIVLDGIAPTVSGISFLPASGSFRTGQSLVVTLQVTEPVLVGGSPTLRLIGDSASNIPASFQKVAGSSILFDLGVAAGQNAANLAYNLNTCIAAGELSLATDLAGNPLVLPAGSDVNSGVVIDTSKPVTPDVTGVADGITYTTAVNIGLGNLETAPGTTVKYSLDGGTSWNDYTDPVGVSTDGSYTFVAWQEDAAGNRSPSSTPISFELDVSLPSVTGISCETPDGSYGFGSLLRFKLAFSEKVRTTGAGASITIGGTKLVPVTTEGDGSTSLVFDYTVAAGDSFDPVTVTAVNLVNITDMNNNAPASTTPTVPAFSRSGLVVDGVVPAPNNWEPASDAVESPTELKIYFDTDVFKESGTVSIERTGDWSIPIVMDEAEFAKWYYSSALDEDDRLALMFTENGSPLLDRYTGLPVGPYRKLTHGLVAEAGNMIPDTSTKYVLDFGLSPANDTGFAYDVNNDGDTLDENESVGVGAIRAALAKAGYHRYTVELASSAITVSGSTVTIVLPESLVPGREWTVTVPAGAFRDSAGNTNEAFTWNFWSAGTATPVVRVDRYSHGWGSKQPEVTGLFVEGNPDTGATGVVTGGTIATSLREVGEEDTATVPTGFVRVRIDCETPGADIEYLALRHSTATIPGAPANPSNSTNADIEKTALDALVPATVYSGFFALGDSSLTTASKYYVVARASKAASGTEPALDPSGLGAEGAFKSIIFYENPQSAGALRFQGSTVLGGLPTIAGFPLRDADPDKRFSKWAYNEPASDDWYWVSWEIVGAWFNQSVRGNWQQDYNDNTYGNYLYTNNRAYW